ncbi:YgaP-like transmembrane domain [Pelotomaculum propionicicum]|uniref:YgaP-like transmembrane domain n=1 Tax=Pelotomaculum propionicicum TaxID=258475 RepID=UPI003B8004BD
MILTYKKNLGTFDRMVRAGIGLYLLWLVFIGAIVGWWTLAAFLFALFHLVESFLGY